MFSIRTTYPNSICYRPDGAASDSIAPPFLLGSPDSMAARVLLGNPDGVDPDSLGRFVSSGIGVPTPCTRRRSPLRVIAQSTRGRIPCENILHPNISQPDGRGGWFNFSGYTYPDPLIALTWRVFLSVYSVAVFSWSFLIFPTDILRYFILDICCLNPQSLLVTHLS